MTTHSGSYWIHLVCSLSHSPQRLAPYIIHSLQNPIISFLPLAFKRRSYTSEWKWNYWNKKILTFCHKIYKPILFHPYSPLLLLLQSRKTDSSLVGLILPHRLCIWSLSGSKSPSSSSPSVSLQILFIHSFWNVSLNSTLSRKFLLTLSFQLKHYFFWFD